MPNYRLTLCYDGTRWKGWQKQGNTDHTIQGKLETLLSRLLDQPIEVAASGRTDAGTHAKRQVVSFRAKTALTTQEILVEMADTHEMQDKFDELLARHRGQVTESSLTREEGYLRMEITAKLEPPITHEEALAFMKENDGVRRISV